MSISRLKDRIRIAQEEMESLILSTGQRAPSQQEALLGVLSELNEVLCELEAGQTGSRAQVDELRDCEPADEQLPDLSAILDFVQDAIIVNDSEGRVIFWNKRAERLYGWTASEVIGIDYADLFRNRESLSQLQLARKELASRGEWMGELRQATKSGKEILVQSRWSTVRSAKGDSNLTLVISTDVTEERELEKQLIQAQRIHTIGMMATGIAHDIGNALSPLLMAIEGFRKKLADEESQYFLALLKLNAERGAALVNDVLALARSVEGARRDINLQLLLRETFEIIRAALPDPIKIKQEIQPDLWMINADATQVYQVLMNVCMNAQAAMPDGGILTIMGANALIDKEQTGTPKRYVLLKISDTGVGIPAEIRDKIFDAFFTTKEPGRGTGLGLSTVRRIVNNHGGFIQVRSTVGGGTDFEIYLPACE